jgi:hypothetical protein
MSNVPGFKAHTPDPQPIRHTRIFSEAEVITALKFYLSQDGVEVPEGRTAVWGLDHECLGSRESHLTLVIDVPPK